jgi:MYXO-CTERM domain-containing protein
MRTLQLVVVGSLLSPAAALAESQQSPIEEAPQIEGWMISERQGGTQSVRQVLARTGQIDHAGETLILYINKNGTTLAPGNNDSRTNRSTLVDQTTAIPAWNVSAGDWAAIMDCTRTMWSPFNVLVTDVDPGNVPHMESIVTTLSSTINMDPNVGGVSPYTIGCDVIPNSIVFTFAEAFGGDPETICEVMGQEMAHSIGLDHQMLASDPMTYLQYNGLQAFRNETVSCGEYQNRACGLQGECGATQNSYQMLLERVGTGGGGENGIPSIAITSPSPGANVPPSFTVTTDATDDTGVASVELWVDGALTDTRTAAPWSFEVSDLLEGAHSLQTIVYDVGGQSATAQVSVTVSADAPDPDGDGGSGDPDDPSPSELVGGCSTSGGAGATSLGLLGLALLGLRRRRR